MSSMSPELQVSLDDTVGEVLGLLTGLDLTYEPELERYRSITRQINRALRNNALEQEWSYYSALLSLGTLSEGDREMLLPTQQRPRIINDDAVRLLDDEQRTVKWAYYLPRDSLHKYERRRGLWVSVTRKSLMFSRPIFESEAGLEVVLSVMREPRMFRLPAAGKTVPTSVRKQLLDFPYPDAIISRAAFYYAQTDPVMQPRVPTLEEGYKDIMYQLIERDVSNTDTPYQNTFTLPIQSGLVDDSGYRPPLADY
jgi:hypothetical protein